MEKIFVVRKDPQKPGSDDNSIVMCFKEFDAFLRTEEGQRRKDCFIKLDAVDESDAIIFLESSREEAIKKKQEQNHSDYLHRQQKERGVLEVSLDMPIDMGEEGDETTLLDLIADEAADTEKQAVEQIIHTELPAALGELDHSELDLILAFYIREEKMTVNRYAESTGESRRQIRKRHDSAIRKLRLYYRRKKLM